MSGRIAPAAHDGFGTPYHPKRKCLMSIPHLDPAHDPSLKPPAPLHTQRRSGTLYIIE